MTLIIKDEDSDLTYTPESNKLMRYLKENKARVVLGVIATFNVISSLVKISSNFAYITTHAFYVATACLIMSLVSTKSEGASYLYHIAYSTQLFVTAGYWLVVRDPVNDGPWYCNIYKHGVLLFLIGFIWMRSGLRFDESIAQRCIIVWTLFTYAWLFIYYFTKGIQGKDNNYGPGVIYRNIKFDSWYQYTLLPICFVGINVIWPHMLGGVFRFKKILHGFSENLYGKYFPRERQ